MKRNYRAERVKAMRYADETMNGEDGKGLKQREWLDRWSLVYIAFLRGLRASNPTTAGREP